MKPVATLPGSYLQPQATSLPAPLQALRRQRGEALADMPLPSRKTENWKYSSRRLKLADELATTLPVPHEGGSTQPAEGYTIVIRNGVVIRGSSRFPEINGVEVLPFADLSDADAEFLASRLDDSLDTRNVQMAALNGARFEDGLLIRLADNAVVDAPVFLVFETDASTSGSAYPRLYVDAGRNSQVTVVEEYINRGDEAALVNAVSEYRLAGGAQVTSVRLTVETDTVQHVGATGVKQARDSRFESHCVGFGGPLRRHDLQVRLEGEGAECLLNGVAVTQDRQHFDNHTCIEHVAPRCNSEETYRNIAADQSQIVFNGRIHIHQDAQKSDANLNNRNLLLSTGAEIDTKPELEIYADDVKCAHGATVGQLNEESLFYLVSRGIGRREAGVLLTMAFVNELLEQIPVESVRETAQEKLGRFIEKSFEDDAKKVLS